MWKCKYRPLEIMNTIVEENDERSTANSLTITKITEKFSTEGPQFTEVIEHYLYDIDTEGVLIFDATFTRWQITQNRFYRIYVLYDKFDTICLEIADLDIVNDIVSFSRRPPVIVNKIKNANKHILQWIVSWLYKLPIK